MKRACITFVSIGLVTAACGGSSGSVEPLGNAAPSGSSDLGAPEVAPGSTSDSEDPTGATKKDGGTGPLRGFGEACTASSQCAGGACTSDDGPQNGTCTRPCSQETPNDCRKEKTLCLEIGGGSFVCSGPEVTTGTDTDDANLGLGDCVTRELSPLGDADLFFIRAAYEGPMTISVVPQNPGLDVGFRVYDGAGSQMANLNDKPPGVREGLNVKSWIPSNRAFVLVYDAGSSVAGSYRICAEKTPTL